MVRWGGGRSGRLVLVLKKWEARGEMGGSKRTAWAVYATTDGVYCASHITSLPPPPSHCLASSPTSHLYGASLPTSPPSLLLTATPLGHTHTHARAHRTRPAHPRSAHGPPRAVFQILPPSVRARAGIYRCVCVGGQSTARRSAGLVTAVTYSVPGGWCAGQARRFRLKGGGGMRQVRGGCGECGSDGVGWRWRTRELASAGRARGGLITDI